MTPFMDDGRGPVRWNLDFALEAGQHSWFTPFGTDSDAFAMIGEGPSLPLTASTGPAGETGDYLPLPASIERVVTDLPFHPLNPELQLDEAESDGFFMEARVGDFRGHATIEDFGDLFLSLPDGELGVPAPVAGWTEADGLPEPGAGLGGGDNSYGMQALLPADLDPNDAWFSDLASTVDPWG